MEIETIRPLFRQYNIEDVLRKVKEYIEEYNEGQKEEYKNIETYKTKINGRYVSIKIHYFGVFYTELQKRVIYESLEEYISLERRDRTIKEKNRILYSRGIGRCCSFNLKTR